MTTGWRSQLYRRHGRHADPTVVSRAVATGEAIIAVHSDLAPVFTLRHLAHMSGVDYGLLRTIAARTFADPYTRFRIKKRPSAQGELRYRVICVPTPGLMRAQRWVAQNILS